MKPIVADLWGRLARLGRDRSGAASLEFGMTALSFTAIILAAVGFGAVLETRNELFYAVDHGARTVFIDPTAGADDVAASIRGKFDHPDGQYFGVTIGSTTINGVDYRTMTLTYPLSIYVPFVDQSITLSIDRRTPAI